MKLIYADDGDVPAGMESYEALLARSEPMPDAMRTAADLAGIFYTGGTTGRSKGVMLSHGNLMANALNALGEGLFQSSAIYLHAAPMFHLANGAAMYSLLLSGGSNVMIQAFTPEGMMAAVQNEHVTDVLLVPTMIQMLVDHPALGSYDLSSLKNIIYGASPISEAVLEQGHCGASERAIHPSLRHDRIVADRNRCCIGRSISAKAAPRAATGRRAAPRLAARYELSMPTTNPCPYGTVGEIVVRGDNVMMGYWERPEETARAVIDGWMHTGDGGYMDEHGFVFVVDRVKDMIISGGENVYSVEVENAVTQHPAVAQCAVIGIPDERWGELVHAVVVTKSGAKVSAGRADRILQDADCRL